MTEHSSSSNKVLTKVLGCGFILGAALLSGTTGASAASLPFTDNFGGSMLDPAWQVQAGQGDYSLAGGSLRYSNQGPQSAPAGWVTTSLTLALPFSGTRWQLDAKASYNLYWLNASGFSSGAQRPQVIVSFDALSPFDDYADFDRGVDAYYNDNHLSAWYNTTTAEGLLNPADAAIANNIAGGEYWYRIVRDGGSLTMKYSYDGVDFKTALSAALLNPSSSYNQLLLSGTTWETVGSFTDFDFVTVHDLGQTVSPEPGTLSLVVLFLLAGGLWRLRRRSA